MQYSIDDRSRTMNIGILHNLSYVVYASGLFGFIFSIADGGLIHQILKILSHMKPKTVNITIEI